MVLYVGNDLSQIVKVGTVDVESIYKGLGMIWHRDLPSGTVLFERHNTNERTYSGFELILPTEQEVEIVIVGGGGGTAGDQADL